MIQVLNVISDTNIGGAGRVLVNYLRFAHRDRFEISVALPRGSLLKAPLEEAGGRADPQALAGAPGATLMVTPRDIDQRVEDMAKVIGYALSLSLQPALDLESLQALIE